MLLIRLSRAIRALSLAIWLGGGVMTFITAVYVFGVAGEQNRKLAGDIMAPILHTGGVLKLILAALALLTHGVLRNDPTSGRTRRTHRFGFVMLALATVIVLITMVHLEPTLIGLRQQYVNDPNYKSHPAYTEFKNLHGLSMGLGTLELVFVAIALICVAI